MNKIYNETNAMYDIKWDVYYKNLSIHCFDGSKKIAQVIMFISELMQNINFLIKETGKFYEAKYANESISYKAVFVVSTCREDVVSKINLPIIKIEEKYKWTIQGVIEFIKAAFPAKCIEDLYRKKFKYLKKKFEKLNFPNEIYVEEGVNIHQRAFVCAAFERGVKLKCTFRAGKIIENYEFPGEVMYHDDNNELIICENIPNNQKPKIKSKCILILPTYNNVAEVIEWVESCIKYFEIQNWGLSIHPSYQYQINQLDDEMIVKIDKNKDSYEHRYEYAVGCYSTMLNQWNQKGKKVYSYTTKRNKKTDIEYMKIFNSNVKVYIGD